jgi:hypothetical protein
MKKVKLGKQFLFLFYFFGSTEKEAISISDKIDFKVEHTICKFTNIIQKHVTSLHNNTNFKIYRAIMHKTK